MQEHAPEAVLLQRLVQVEVPVLVVAEDRVAGTGKVDADLVGAAGLDGDFEEGALNRTLTPTLSRKRESGKGSRSRGREA